LKKNGIELIFETIVSDLIIEDGKIKGVKIKEAKYVEDEEAELQDIYADKVVIACGRKGANWLVEMCNKSLQIPPVIKLQKGKNVTGVLPHSKQPFFVDLVQSDTEYSV
jgi:hypothetical protein